MRPPPPHSSVALFLAVTVSADNVAATAHEVYGS